MVPVAGESFLSTVSIQYGMGIPLHEEPEEIPASFIPDEHFYDWFYVLYKNPVQCGCGLRLP